MGEFQTFHVTYMRGEQNLCTAIDWPAGFHAQLIVSALYHIGGIIFLSGSYQIMALRADQYTISIK